MSSSFRASKNADVSELYCSLKAFTITPYVPEISPFTFISPLLILLSAMSTSIFNVGDVEDATFYVEVELTFFIFSTSILPFKPKPRTVVEDISISLTPLILF